MTKKLWNLLREPDCRRCDLFQTAQCVCLIGDGPFPTDHMLIGEAPGFREDDVRKPFAGKAGKLLDKILKSVELDRARIFISNVVHCRPPGNKKPSISQLRACKYFIDKEIEHVKPKIIVLMGRAAITGISGDKNLVVEAARANPFKYKGAKVYSTYHPAAALRKPYLVKVIRKDLKSYLLSKKTEEGLQMSYEDFDSNLKDGLREARKIGIDVETTGTNFKKDSLLHLSVSPKAGRSYFIKDPSNYRKYLKSLIDDPSTTKIAHYLKFDLKNLIYNNYGSERNLPNNNFFCTMIAYNILDENYLQKDLEHLADMFTSMGRWKTPDDFENPRLLRMRNLKDADAHKRLYNIFSKKLEKQGLVNVFKIDMNMMKVLVSMELHGVKIDTKELNQLDKNISATISKFEKKIKVNARSNKQLTEYFRSLGIRSMIKTGGGGQSWDKNVLEKLSTSLTGRRKEIVDFILEYKKLFGIKSKFLDNLRSFLDVEDCVHPVFNQVKAYNTESGDEEGTLTGRLSCKDPPLQQIPRDREDLEREINPRRLFIPSYPGGFVLSADYDQIEVRIVAHESGDETLIDLLKKGGDVHRLIASQILNKSPEKVTKDERKDTKKVVFGIIYLISARGLASKIGCEEEKAAKYIRHFFRSFPGVEEWQDWAENEIIINQEISNMFGRKRRLPGATSQSGIGRALIRQGVNFPIQSGAIDITKVAMYKIFCDLIKRELKSRMFANIHDEIAITGPPGEEKEVIKIVKSRLENPELEEYGVDLKVPLKVSLKIGLNWLDQKEV